MSIQAMLGQIEAMSRMAEISTMTILYIDNLCCAGDISGVQAVRNRYQDSKVISEFNQLINIMYDVFK